MTLSLQATTTTTTTTTNTTTDISDSNNNNYNTNMSNTMNSSSNQSDNNDNCNDPNCYYTSTTEEMIADIIITASSVSQYNKNGRTTTTTTFNNNNNTSLSLQNEIQNFNNVATTALIGYRSVGIGMFGAIMRYIGMPLEKIALYMNSSQVIVVTSTTKSTMKPPSQFQQAITLTFQNGYLSPYRVVGISSFYAWFLQYSVMGIAFQFFDQVLSNMLHVQPMYYGRELMEPPPPSHDSTNTTGSSSSSYYARESFKTIMSPLLAASLESLVSNRAEVQRFYGPQVFQQVQQQLLLPNNTMRKMNPFIHYTGPAYTANVMRNIIMCQTSFVITPYTYKMYFPQEHKNKTTLFYYGLSLNIFIGNVIAITQQALWGRSLDYLRQHTHINYTNVIKEGYNKEGISAFFTPSKWFSRVLMNAPAQGTLPWFYNEILPIGEYNFLYTLYNYLYQPFLKDIPMTYSNSTGNTTTNNNTNTVTNNNHQIPTTLAEMNLQQHEQQSSLRPCNIQRTRTHYGTLPTANPEFDDDNDNDSNHHNKSGTSKKHHHHHHHHKLLHPTSASNSNNTISMSSSDHQPQQQSSPSSSPQR